MGTLPVRRRSGAVPPIAAVARWVLVGLLLWAPPAIACVSDAECDDGVTCTLPDTCQAGVCVPGGGGDADGDGTCDLDDNCPSAPNANQQDIDGDDEGDVCDAQDVDLNVVQARVRRSINMSKPNGAIILKGDFLRFSPELPLTPAGCYLVRVKDSVTLDVSFSFPQAECTTNDKGRIKCKNATNTRQLILQPIAGLGQKDYKFTAKFTKQNLSGPFNSPVHVTIVNGPPVLVTGVDRVGSIVDCRQTTLGMTCKE